MPRQRDSPAGFAGDSPEPRVVRSRWRGAGREYLSRDRFRAAHPVDGVGHGAGVGVGENQVQGSRFRYHFIGAVPWIG